MEKKVSKVLGGSRAQLGGWPSLGQAKGNNKRQHGLMMENEETDRNQIRQTWRKMCSQRKEEKTQHREHGVEPTSPGVQCSAGEKRGRLGDRPLKAACTLDRSAALAEADAEGGPPPEDGGLLVGGFIV